MLKCWKVLIRYRVWLGRRLACRCLVLIRARVGRLLVRRPLLRCPLVGLVLDLACRRRL